MSIKGAIRRGGTAALLSLCIVALWCAPALAAAEPRCAGLLLGCVIEETAEKLKTPVKEVTDNVEEIVETGGGAVEDVVETVTGTIDEDTTFLRPPPDPGPEELAPVSLRPRRLRIRRYEVAAGDPAPRRRTPPTITSSASTRESTEFSGIAIANPVPRLDVVDFAGIALEMAGRFAFPLALSLVVAVFLVVQHWMDRRDPKLASAPIDEEMLAFG